LVILRLKVDALAAKQPAGAGCCGGDASEQPVPGVDALFVYDVAEQWRKMTGKPCVLAVWAGRREIVTPELVADFQASREYGLSHIGEIVEDAALNLEMPPRYLERYLRENIDFSLDEHNLDGLRKYFELCAEAGLIPSARPIEFAEGPEGAMAPQSRAEGAR
jgi:chorismate dehydratase